MVGRQETFLNFRHSRMAETVTFWHWWQPFNSFCIETLFLSLFLFFLLCKKVCVCEGGGGDMLPSPSPVSPPLNDKLKSKPKNRKDSYFIVYERPPQNQNPLDSSVTLILHPVNCETPHDSWLNKENLNSYENKQVWVEARRHQNRRGLCGPNLDHNFFFFFLIGFSSTRY